MTTSMMAFTRTTMMAVAVGVAKWHHHRHGGGYVGVFVSSFSLNLGQHHHHHDLTTTKTRTMTTILLTPTPATTTTTSSLKLRASPTNVLSSLFLSSSADDGDTSKANTRRDDYDDFFDDFDPSDYEDVNRQYSNNNDDDFGGGGGGNDSFGGGRGGGRRQGGGGRERFGGGGGRPGGDRRGGGGDRGGGYRGGRDRFGGGDRGGGGGGRSYGGERFGGGGRGGFDDGRGHDYVRDVDADSSRVDVPTIDALLAERLQARKTGQFDIADDIRDVLLDEHGVLIRDKDKVWRSGSSRSGSGQKWTSSDRRQQNDRRPRNRRDGYGDGDAFGSGPPIDPVTGHDYSLAQDAGPIVGDATEEEIHSLLAERMACKLARDFNRADEIQSKLFEMDVLVNDSQKLWRADGKSFGRNFTPRQYVESEYSEGVSSPTMAEEVEKLIAQRSLAKAERIFKRADALRDELLTVYNVAVDDKLQEWSVGGDFGATTVGSDNKYDAFTCAKWSTPPPDADEIQRLVEERDAARVKRQFDLADSIREQLRDRDIVIDDRKRVWYDSSSVDEGGRDMDSNNGRQEKVFLPYKQRGGGGDDLTTEDIQTIESMLSKRDEHKGLRQFRSADEIRDRLRADYDIRVDDVNREWHVFSDDYNMSQDTSIDDMDLKALIQQKVEDRAAARTAKNYDLADDIRFDLERDYGVIIDDRVREWYVENNNLSSSKAAAEFDNDDDEYDDDDDDNDDEYDAVEALDVEEKETEVATSPSVQIDAGLEDFQSLKVPELKDLLREKGLKVSGNKSELIDRLIQQQG